MDFDQTLNIDIRNKSIWSMPSMNGLALGRSLRSCGTKLGHYWCASNPDCGLISPHTSSYLRRQERNEERNEEIKGRKEKGRGAEGGKGSEEGMVWYTRV